MRKPLPSLPIIAFIGSWSLNGLLYFKETNFVLMLMPARPVALNFYNCWRHLPAPPWWIYKALVFCLGLDHRIPITSPLGIWDHWLFHTMPAEVGQRLKLAFIIWGQSLQESRVQAKSIVFWIKQAWVHIPTQPLSGLVAITMPQCERYFHREASRGLPSQVSSEHGFYPLINLIIFNHI